MFGKLAQLTIEKDSSVDSNRAPNGDFSKVAQRGGNKPALKKRERYTINEPDKFIKSTGKVVKFTASPK